MITNATLRWTTRDVVLHTITFKHLHVAAIHLHRNGNDQLSFCILQHVTHRRLEIEVISGTIKLLLGNCERVEFFLKGSLGRHAFAPGKSGFESGTNPMSAASMFQANWNTWGLVVSKHASKAPATRDGTGNQRRNS